jgi:CRISPR-associated protein Csx16
VDRHVEHLDMALIAPGDWVMGSLPVHMAAAVCAKGAHYFHLAMQLPASARGCELTAESLRLYGARLTGFQIVVVD